LRRHKVIRLFAFTIHGLIEKVENYCDDLERRGLFEVLSVSFYYSCAYITIRSYEGKFA